MGWELPIKSCFRKPKGNLELSLCCDCSHPTFPKAAGAPLPALTWLSSRSMLVSSRFRMNLWGNSAFFSSLMCSENLCSGLQKKITLVRRGKNGPRTCHGGCRVKFWFCLVATRAPVPSPGIMESQGGLEGKDSSLFLHSVTLILLERDLSFL